MIQQYQTSKRHLLHFGGQISMPKQQCAADTDNLSLAVILKTISYRDRLRSSFESTKTGYTVQAMIKGGFSGPWKALPGFCLVIGWITKTFVVWCSWLKAHFFWGFTEVHFPTVEISVSHGDKWWVFSPQTNISFRRVRKGFLSYRHRDRQGGEIFPPTIIKKKKYI